MNSQLNCFHSVHCNCSAVQSMSEHVHQQLCYTGCTAARRLFPASWIWYSSEYGMTPEQKKSQHVVSVFGSDKSISIKLLQITKITEVYVLSSQCFTDSVSLNCFATFTQKHLFPFLWSLLVCMAFFFLFFFTRVCSTMLVWCKSLLSSYSSAHTLVLWFYITSPSLDGYYS